MDDLEAIRLLKSGDLNGLEALMERYQVKAARAAFLITHDIALAQDVVQETFLRIHDRIHQFDPSHPFEPYLIRSVIHASLNVVRGDKRLASLDDENELQNLLDRAASVESQREYVPTGSQIGDCSCMAKTVRMSVFYLRTGSETFDDVPQARWIKWTALTDHK